MTRIVRKVCRHTGETIPFWLSRSGEVRGWVYDPNLSTPEEEVERDGGWGATEDDARDCNTTLAALRAELEGEG